MNEVLEMLAKAAAEAGERLDDLEVGLELVLVDAPVSPNGTLSSVNDSRDGNHSKLKQSLYEILDKLYVINNRIEAVRNRIDLDTPKATAKTKVSGGSY